MNSPRNSWQEPTPPATRGNMSKLGGVGFALSAPTNWDGTMKNDSLHSPPKPSQDVMAFVLVGGRRFKAITSRVDGPSQRLRNS